MKKMDCLSLVRFSFVIILFTVFSANAQQIQGSETELLTDEDTTTVVPALDIFSEIADGPAESQVSSYLLKDRFEDLQNEIPLRYNEHSHRYVDFFVEKRTAFTRRMLETKDVYFPTFEKTLAKYGLPEEFKYLPLIESGLDPRIVSRAGAGGLWQFMRATGREFGLQQNQYIDERFHPEKATEAACRYLTQLHRIFGDWEMVLAAYNCGPGNIRRAIRRTGRSDFWGIYPVLPKETRNYVPQFVAMLYVMNYANDHGLAPSELKLIPATDTLQVDGYLNLRTFTALGGMTMDEIYELNPHLISDYIPASANGFNLKIPAIKAALLCEDLVGILDSSKAMGPRDLIASKSQKDGYETIHTTVRHKVASGQTLSSIAKQHRVTVAQLRSWNRIQGSMLRKGQYLVVQKSVRRPIKEVAKEPVVIAQAASTSVAEKVEVVETPSPEASVEAVAEEASEESTLVASNEETSRDTDATGHMTEAALMARQAERLQASSQEVPRSESERTATPVQKTVAARGTRTVHKIQSGESLLSISKKYGVSVEDLKKENGLTSTKLVAGKKLFIGGKEEIPVSSAKPKKPTVARELYHVVEAGDTLWAISKRYGLSVDRIKRVNNIKGDALKKGMKILISG
jgi:membrane-bound lytic murein transglycosylase D